MVQLFAESSLVVIGFETIVQSAFVGGDIQVAGIDPSIPSGASDPSRLNQALRDTALVVHIIEFIYLVASRVGLVWGTFVIFIFSACIVCWRTIASLVFCVGLR